MSSDETSFHRIKLVATVGQASADRGTTNLLKIHRVGTGPFFEVH